MRLPGIAGLRRLAGRLLRRRRYPVRLRPTQKPTRGRALFSFLHGPVRLGEDDPGLLGHVITWCSREIARLLAAKGFAVDAIELTDSRFRPRRRYDVVFDIGTNLARFSAGVSSKPVQLLLLTGSDPFYLNAAERRRLEQLRGRRGFTLATQRQVADPEAMIRSLEIADGCALIGNEYTRNTYPGHLRSKIETVPVPPSDLGGAVKRAREYVPDAREFLWFFGSGAVRKGLDLVLEVFARSPSWVLNVVGDVEAEPDFFQAYRPELLEAPNIRYHGYLLPNSSRFRDILSTSFSFVAPCAAEGTSAAAVTCMTAGLYPIVSRDAGVDLPAGAGRFLEENSLDEIEAAVADVHRRAASDLASEIEAVQGFAAAEYSRPRFKDAMRSFLDRFC
jgi:glycosyltransferase involved in cell wall biosynthesis